MYRFGLIGYPVQHSLSPWIHEQFLSKSKLSGNYLLKEINLDQLFAEEIKKLREEKINGFNVTVPYKQTIIPYLDDLDTEAKEIGAVNTVVNRNGKWIGYNTDGKGYLRSLESSYPHLFENKKKRILILGAGGAARGIYYALVTWGFHEVDIANRTTESALEISKLKTKNTITKVLSLDNAEQTITKYDCIIQTTSVGMNPGSEQSIITLDNLKTTQVLSDIVYQPIKTNFLTQAEKLGASIHLGHTMLLYQAQYAFEIWTGKRIPIDNMDTELKLILEGR